MNQCTIYSHLAVCLAKQSANKLKETPWLLSPSQVRIQFVHKLALSGITVSCFLAWLTLNWSAKWVYTWQFGGCTVCTVCLVVDTCSFQLCLSLGYASLNTANVKVGVIWILVAVLFDLVDRCLSHWAVGSIWYKRTELSWTPSVSVSDFYRSKQVSISMTILSIILAYNLRGEAHNKGWWISVLTLAMPRLAI